jgi:dCMP deaminase
MTFTRPTKDEYNLGIAEAVAKRSTCLRCQYGAVIVKNDQIVATGYNGSPRDSVNCCDTGVCERARLKIPDGEQYDICMSVHAEMNALIQGRDGGRDLASGATLYIAGIPDGQHVVQKSPCKMCQRLIKNVGLQRTLVKDTRNNIVYEIEG